MVFANRIPVILSVDKNSATLYARYKVLQRAGYGALSAIDGEQALSMFEAYPVDLVLLDYAMPGTDGEIFVRKPWLVWTASLRKLVGPAVLLERIGELLSRERGLEIANA